MRHDTPRRPHPPPPQERREEEQEKKTSFCTSPTLLLHECRRWLFGALRQFISIHSVKKLPMQNGHHTVLWKVELSALSPSGTPNLQEARVWYAHQSTTPVRATQRGAMEVKNNPTLRCHPRSTWLGLNFDLRERESTNWPPSSGISKETSPYEDDLCRQFIPSAIQTTPGWLWGRCLSLARV